MANPSQPQPIYLDSTHSIETRVNDLLGRMNVDEKLAQLTAFWFNDIQIDQQPSVEKMHALLADGIGQISRVGGSSTLPPVEIARAGNAVQRFLREHTRLKIPAILHEECCAGYMALGATIFPQIIGLASTWNPGLAEKMTREIRRQMLAVGARQGLAPNLDVGSDPRWGRIEETFGEDPLLITQFGLAYVRGLQGNDGETPVMATAKHFVGHSLSAGGLNCAPVQVGPRALWDIYVMPFQAAIRDAGLRAIMNAYPELDGDVVAASRAVLTDLLRGQLGFEGLVVADYEAIPMIHSYHRVAPDERTAAVMGLRAGIEVELPTRACYGEPLRAALEAGEISMEEVEAVVRHVLQVKFELGLFENPYVDDGRAAAAFETPEQRGLAREIARQSLVLLKNDGLLPLASPRTVAVIGPNADAPRNMLGDYSYPATLELMSFAPKPGSAFIGGYDKEYVRRHSPRVASILEAVRAQAGGQTEVLYARGCPVLEADRSGFDEAVEAARQADVVLLVLGDKSGLVPDCTAGETRDRADLGLPGEQEALARAIVAVGKPVAAILINGRPLSAPWLHDNVAAILEAWLPGEEGAAAVAEAVFGAANPGGKLPVTVPYSVGQVPINYYHKQSGGRSHWYVDYVETPAAPLYPFGHGLSYTTFCYSNLSISPAEGQAGEQVDIRLALTNAGKTAGEEVVQLYVCDEYARVPRPAKELKGFCRVALAPGECRTVTFHLPVDMLAYYDENLELALEAGTVQVMVGGSSEDIRLEGAFEIGGPRKSRVGRRVFECPVTVE